MKRTLTGFRAWLVQRMTALYLLAFVAFFLAHFLFDAPASYADWQAWVVVPFNSLALWLFFAALSTHAWVGGRDAVLDYVHSLPARIAVMALLAGALVAVLASVSRILFVAHS